MNALYNNLIAVLTLIGLAVQAIAPITDYFQPDEAQVIAEAIVSASQMKNQSFDGQTKSVLASEPDVHLDLLLDATQKGNLEVIRFLIDEKKEFATSGNWLKALEIAISEHPTVRIRIN